MAEYIQPFDFQKVLVEYFLGTQELLVFAFVIVFSFACATYRMSNKIFLSLLSITSIMLSSFLGEWVYFVVIFLLGLIVSKTVARIVDR